MHGAFVSLGREGAVGAAGIAAKVLASEETPQSVDVAFSIVRFLALVLVLLLAGGAVVFVAVLGTAARRCGDGSRSASRPRRPGSCSRRWPG